MGVFFFWLFYQTVVVGVKKRKQDYEDRVKIEQPEEEERRKMHKWEGAMEAAEALSTSEEWGKKGMSEEETKRHEEVEKYSQLKIRMKFMKSGEDVQEAPQAMEVDYAKRHGFYSLSARLLKGETIVVAHNVGD